MPSFPLPPCGHPPSDVTLSRAALVQELEELFDDIDIPAEIRDVRSRFKFGNLPLLLMRMPALSFVATRHAEGVQPNTTLMYGSNALGGWWCGRVGIGVHGRAPCAKLLFVSLSLVPMPLSHLRVGSAVCGLVHTPRHCEC